MQDRPRFFRGAGTDESSGKNRRRQKVISYLKQGLIIFFEVYYYIILGRILLSFFQNQRHPALSTVYRLFYALTEPLLSPLRRVIPPVPWGTAYLDLSPLALFFLMAILRNLVIAYL
ncbi:MAG TPA: YggT family protein [Bacillota bacterium]|jgi:uncharacterized protein YggT (Ycf19 family)|nr:YggT family protein [Bacillota bacterium]HOB87915.1 YggT family protein [Bacillota bacterium]HOP69138.1 YggT family protein [Bacillota bacterium]HPT33806.1 YggT family protein [Bacillota bacterium]HPZ65308.1 YggT family protein [Bacillota bacterium]